MSIQHKAVRASFWKNKRVLITGHTGFKGSWLALWLQELGAEVIGLALEPPTTPSLFEKGRVGEGMISVQGDVRDLDTVVDVFERYRPEIVVHMAAQALVRSSYDIPVETYATNVMGTVHVLEAIRRVETVRVGVFVTSDKCYENTESKLWGYRETDAMGGSDPYSNSKGCAELVVSAYRNSYFSGTGDGSSRAAIASVRAGNVIGGGDWAEDRLIPDVIQAFSTGRPVHIRRPDAIRPWQHVLEPLSGYLQLAEQLWHEGAAYTGGWNFGPAESDAKSVEYVVERLIERWGPDASVVLDDGPHPHEATFLRLDCSKAHTLLGWYPRLSLDDALAWTVEWYRAANEGADLRTVTLDQIQRYQDVSQAIPSIDVKDQSPLVSS
jgi:CDP-glucose 4,6-dehydratase